MTFFEQYADFVNTDVRTKRTGPAGYTITTRLLDEKHKLMLPADLVNGKSVLDLGCCVGASGAWSLAHGASEYVGVELQGGFADIARTNLENNFSGKRFEIVQANIEDYLKTCNRNFDIILICGVLEFVIDYQNLIDLMCKIGDTIFVETGTPPILESEALSSIPGILYAPITQYMVNHGGVYENGSSLIAKVMVNPSISVLNMLFYRNGFTGENDKFQSLAVTVGRPYGANGKARTIIEYTRTHGETRMDFVESYKSSSKDLVRWPTLSTLDSATERLEYLCNVSNYRLSDDPWKFDDEVAKTFVRHAKSHIPDYMRVIARSVDICQSLNDKNLRIIDVGCATGETLRQLYRAGFCNLVGVDSSQSMINHCPTEIASIVCSDTFPKNMGNFNVILCNWTLHFIQGKERYLTDMMNHLQPGGYLILTDKTENDGKSLEMYHNFKRGRGLTEDEIRAKAESLKTVMHINDVPWYQTILRQLGFERVSIINATYCFTTFLAIKKS